MAVTLPLRSDLPHFDFQCELDGSTYGFEFWWNSRSETWTMSIFDAEGVALVRGVRVVVGFPLASRSRDSGVPPGTFLAFDTSGKSEDPGLEDLGKRVLLLYFSPGEAAAG